MFDARGGPRVAFAVAHPQAGRIYKATFRDCVFYNFTHALELCAPALNQPVNGWIVQDCDFAWCDYAVYGDNVGYLTLRGGCIDFNETAGIALSGARGCHIEGVHFEGNALDIWWGAASRFNGDVGCNFRTAAKVRDEGVGNGHGVRFVYPAFPPPPDG